MTEAHLFSIGLALAALAGVRVCLTVSGIGLAGVIGWVDRPAALSLVEFVAGKIPGMASGRDLRGDARLA